MRSTRILFVVLLAPALALLLATEGAHAAGGSGGGPSGGGGGRSSGPDPAAAFRAGVELLADGECKKAERKFRIVLSAAKKNPEANYLRGAALQCLGRHKKAARYFKKAIRYDDKLYAAYEKLGASYLALGKEDDARAQLEKLRELESGCEAVCPDKLTRARKKLEVAVSGPGGDSTGPGAAAERPGRHVLLFEPADDPRASYLGAVRLINRQEFEAAIEELDRLSLTVGPHPDVLNYLGYANRRLARFETARHYYERALALDPLHRGANEYLGEMWVELGRLDQANERLAKLREACPFGCAELSDLERLIGSGSIAAR